MNLPDVVVSVFEKGPKDNESDDMRDTALFASMEYLSLADGQQLVSCRLENIYTFAHLNLDATSHSMLDPGHFHTLLFRLSTNHSLLEV